jgi:hypothetical protein
VNELLYKFGRNCRWTCIRLSATWRSRLFCRSKTCMLKKFIFSY